MTKKVVLIVLAVALAGSARAGWLGDAVQGALQGLGERAVDEASEGAYQGVKGGAGKVVDEAARAPSPPEEEPAPPAVPSPSAGGSVPPQAVAPTGGGEGGAPPTPTAARSREGRRRTSEVDVDLPHFSAVLYNFDPEEGEETRTRLSAGGGFVRVEPLGGEEQGINITDLRRQVAYVLSPEEKVYLEFPYGSEDGDEDEGMDFSVFEGGDPCSEYRRSERLGTETVNGRDAVRWHCTDPLDEFEASEDTIWMDAELQLPIRSEDSEGFVFEMREIRTGPQPESLFRVPEGYEKASMPFPFFGGAAQPEASSGEPLAPKVEVPSVPPQDPTEKAEFDLEVMMLRAVRVPSRSEVGLPAYPGARVHKFMPATEGSINDESFQGLPVVELLTEDEPEAVAAWYRERLSEWEEGEFLLNTYFWPGGPFHPLKVSGQETPYVGVLAIPEDLLTYQVMPEARTTIQIRYDPGR